MITASQREREHNKPVKLDQERERVRPLLPLWIKQEHKWGISINGERIRLACRVAPAPWVLNRLNRLVKPAPCARPTARSATV